MRRRKRIIPAAALDVQADLLPDGCTSAQRPGSRHRLQFFVGSASTYRLEVSSSCEEPLRYLNPCAQEWTAATTVVGPCLRRAQPSQEVHRDVTAVAPYAASRAVITTTVVVSQQFVERNGWVTLPAAEGHSGTVVLDCRLA